MARDNAHRPLRGADWLHGVEGQLARSAIAERLFGDRGEAPLLGKYQIVRRVGTGASGVVFEARHIQTGHAVALKVLKDWNPSSVQRLKNEFRALSDVHHPNLVQLHELCLDAEAPFIAMELALGASLARFVRKDSRSSAERLLQVTTQLVDAITTLHAAGVLHRDLKPSNLVVAATKGLVVLDFGLARSLTEQSRDPGSTESGTLRYMAPERLHDGISSEASDWFSVGVLLTELLPFVMEARERGARDASLDARLRALVQLCLRLISLDPPERPGAAELRAFCGLRELPLEPMALRSSAPDDGFGGRARELSVLRTAFSRTQAGCPAIVHVTGPAGIGKTSVVGHFLYELRQETPELTVLTSRCHEHESIPYNALDGIVEQLSRELGLVPGECTSGISADGAAALARLFPVLAAPLGQPAGAAFERETDDAQRARELGFGALRTLFQQLSQTRRLVLYLDDLQWADGDSALALRTLFTTQLPPLLIITSYRCEATAQARAVDALTELASQTGAETYQLPLEPLSDAESMQLAATLARVRGSLDEATLKAISAEAAGSPLFLRMLVQHRGRLGNDEPTGAITLPELLLLALAQLPRECRLLLELSALAARPLDPVVLMAAARADRSPQAWPEHVHRLERLGWLRGVPSASGQALECYHDRVREAVARSVPDEHRRRCHAKLADAAAQTAQSDLEFLAIQNQEAGRHALAAEYAERAGDRAARGFALEHAISLYRRALGCQGGVRPVTLVHKLAEATAGSGRSTDAVPLFLECAERADGLPAVRLRIRAAEMLLRSGLNEDGARVFEPLLRSLGLRFHSSPHSTLISILSSALQLSLRRVDIQAPRATPTEFERQRIDVCLDLGHRLSVTDPLRGCSLLLRGSLLAWTHGTDAQFARALGCCATVLASVGLGSRRRQDALLQQAWTLAGGIDDWTLSAWLRTSNASVAYTRGEFQRSADELVAAQQLVANPTLDDRWFSMESETAVCGMLGLLVNVPELERRVDLALRRAKETGNRWQSAVVTCSRVLVLLARDEPDAAESELDEILRSWPANGSYHIRLIAAWAKAGVLLYRGEALAAWRLIRRYDAHHARAGYKRVQPWVTIRALGEAQLALGAMEHDPELFMGFVERSIRTLRKQRTRYATYGSTLLEASVAHLKGQRDLAAELYRLTAEQAVAQGLDDAAMCARVRESQMLGADETAVSDSDAAWFASQGVKQPAHWIRLTAPVDPGARLRSMR
jgi:eukaryotic-like serine/threonine-protein kinase